MPNACFLDTNLIVYAATGRDEYPDKFEPAVRLLDRDDVCLSTQVLQEFYTVVIRKPAVPLTPGEASAWVDRLATYPCQDFDPRLVRNAIALSQRFHISYWDGAIIAAAERLGAPTLYSEDLNHGQIYGSVRVVNPFKTD